MMIKVNHSTPCTGIQNNLVAVIVLNLEELLLYPLVEVSFFSGTQDL